MAVLSTLKSPSPSAHAQRRKAVVLAALSSAAAAAIYAYSIKSRPQHTSILTGQLWMRELLKGHPDSFYDAMGMTKNTFRRLLSELGDRCDLQDSRNGVSAVEKLGMFLYTAVNGAPYRQTKHRFQHSSSTVSKCFHEILDMLNSRSFYPQYVCLPSGDTPAYIVNNPKLYPFLDGVEGALDCSHVDAFVREEDHSSHRNRKGRLTQNVLATCDWDMKFRYILPGWEGSAADGNVLDYARKTDFTVRPDRYWLADAGLPSCDACLVPFRGERYHLNEFLQGNTKPRNYRELFNLRHAQARNVIERIFGVFKRKFRILRSAPEYSSETQAKLVTALGAIFNFIRVHDPGDINNYDDIQSVQASASTPGSQVACGSLSTYVSSAEKQRADGRRERIAQAMWEQYQMYTNSQDTM